MGIKEKTFVLFLIIVITFPFFFSKKNIQIEKKIKLPNITIKEGDFKSYNISLEKTGKFQKLDLYSQNNYITYNIKINFLKKHGTLYAKKMIYKNVYNFFNTTYITNDYTYKAKKAIYNEKNKILTAYNFKFFNKKIDGKGDKMVYKNDILTGYNIAYTIKGLK